MVLKLRAWHRAPSASTSCWAPGRPWITDRRRAALVPDRSYRAVGLGSGYGQAQERSAWSASFPAPHLPHLTSPTRNCCHKVHPTPSPSPRAPRAPRRPGTVRPARSSEGLDSRWPRTLQLSCRRPGGGGEARERLRGLLHGDTVPVPGGNRTLASGNSLAGSRLLQSLWGPLPELREEKTDRRGGHRGEVLVEVQHQGRPQVASGRAVHGTTPCPEMGAP